MKHTAQTFIPKEKLSKKKQRELNLAKRGTWGALNPVTRMPQNPKAYNRKKVHKGADDFYCEPSYFFKNCKSTDSLSLCHELFFVIFDCAF